MIRDLEPYPGYKPSGIEWLGEIPEQWEVRRLKYIARLAYGDSLAEEVREDGATPVFGSNGIVGRHSMANTLSPALIIGRKGSHGKINYSPVPSFAIDTTFYVDSRTSSADVRWLFYVLSLLRLDQHTEDSAVPGLSREFVYSHWLPFVPSPQQCAIAAFLDRETARIGALVAKKERLIELLQEKRIALISAVVTGKIGVRHDGSTFLPLPSSLRDSGVEWLGKIPEHWDVVQLRRVIAKFVDYRGATPNKASSGVPLVTARNIKNGAIDFTQSSEYIREEDYGAWMVRGLPEHGDVLMTTEAPLGESAQVTDEHIALAQRVMLFKAAKRKLTNGYLKCHFAALAGRAELWSRATGSTAIGIKASHLREILICVPPTDEQRWIIAFIDRETAKIDALEARIRESVEKLKEFRTALISAAVTGKINVAKDSGIG